MDKAEKKMRQFLDNLKFYLYGDLMTFEKLCKEAQDLSGGLSGTSGTSGTFGTSSMAPHPVTVTPPPTTPTILKAGTTGISGYNSLATNFFKKDEPHFLCTIPLTLVVLSAMDILGDLIKPGTSSSSTGANIKRFLDKLITDKSELNCLIFISRHGMAHSFFPKKNIAIKVDSKNPTNQLFFNDDDTITLNVNYLIELFKAKFDKIMKGEGVNFINMGMRYKKLEDEDDKTLKDKKRYPIDLNTFKSKLAK